MRVTPMRETNASRLPWNRFAAGVLVGVLIDENVVGAFWGDGPKGNVLAVLHKEENGKFSVTGRAVVADTGTRLPFKYPNTDVPTAELGIEKCKQLVAGAPGVTKIDLLLMEGKTPAEFSKALMEKRWVTSHTAEIHSDECCPGHDN